MAGFADWRKKAGGMCEKAIQAAATVYLLVAACMVPLYMHDGYYGLGTAKFQLYRNVGFMALPLMVIFAAVKAAGGCKGDAGGSGAGKKAGMGRCRAFGLRTRPEPGCRSFFFWLMALR